MPLGTVVGGPGDNVLGGDPAPHGKGYSLFMRFPPIFLLPVSAHVLVGLLLSLFCNLLRQIMSRLSTVTSCLTLNYAR